MKYIIVISYIYFSTLWLSPVSCQTPLKTELYQPGLIIYSLSIDTVIAGNNNIVSIPSLPSLQKPGLPVIPYLSELILDIPVSANMQVYTGQSRTIDGIQIPVSGQERAKGMEYSFPNESNELIENAAVLTPVETIRGHLTSLLEIFPVRKTNEGIQWFKDITIRISWNPSMGSEPQLFSKSSLEDIKQIGRVLKTGAELNQIPDYQYFPEIVQLTLDTTGWYQLTHQELLDSGIVLFEIDPSALRLWNKQKEIPIFISGDHDGIFDSNDRIIFYGEKNKAQPDVGYEKNFYTDGNVYWLTWGSDKGLRYNLESAYPGEPADQVFNPSFFSYTQRIESDDYFARLGRQNTHQLWDQFDHFFMNPPVNGGTSVDFEIELHTPYNSSTSAFTMKMNVQGITTNRHSLSAYINNYKFADAVWTGQSGYTVISSEDQVLQNEFLQNGLNTITLNLDGNDPTSRYDQVYLNWVEITYDREYSAHEDEIEFTHDSNLGITTQFEINNFSTANIFLFKKGLSRLQDFLIDTDSNTGKYRIIFQDYTQGSSIQYHAFTEDKLRKVSEIRALDQINPLLDEIYSDYIVIAPDSFFLILEPLIEARQGSFVDVDRIYREYNHGILSPYAIKGFLKDLYLNGNVRPKAVLIGMQGKWFGWSGGYNINQHFIPSMKIQTVGFGAASSDFWYTCVSGNDFIPEFAIGRFPAGNKEELSVMVDKTLRQIQTESQAWSNNALFIGGYESTFKDQSETGIGQIIDKGYFPKRLYIDNYSEGGVFFGNTDTLLNHLYNGLSYVNFLGHGGGAVWGDRSLFTLGDIPRLNNEFKTPFVTSMTCFTGDVTNPNSLGRKMLTSESGGASAWFGSAGIAWIINDFLLLQPLLERLFNHSEMGIGEIINEAKVQYYASNTNPKFRSIAVTQIHQFNLSGDPMLSLMTPQYKELLLTPGEAEPGDTIKFPTNPDSLEIRLYDPGNIQVKVRQTESPNAISIPDTAKSGLYTINSVFKNSNGWQHHSSKLGISGSMIDFIDITPSPATSRDLLQVTVRAKDKQGIQGIQLFVGGVYSRDFTLSQVPDTYSLETLIGPFSPGSLQALECRVTDLEGNITASPIKYVSIALLPDFTPNKLFINHENEIHLASTIQNQTKGFGKCEIIYSRFEHSAWIELGRDTLFFNGLGNTESFISGPLKRGSSDFRVVSQSLDDTSSNQSNDTLVTTLTIHDFWVTPKLGTTQDLAVHSAVGIEGVDISIEPAMVDQAFIMTVSGIHTIENNHQPDFDVIALDSNRLGVKVETGSNIPAKVTWFLSEKISPGIKLCAFNSEFQTWLPLVINVTPDSMEIKFEISESGKFAFFNINDGMKPHLEASVNGQKFLNHSYVTMKPVIYFNSQDQNGVDPRIESMTLKINGYDASNEMISKISGLSNNIGIQVNPTLSITDSLLEFVVKDAAGNKSDTLRLSFIVSDKLDLFDYGNFPNPFKTQTRFTYELTETVDEFELYIYTVSGRLIRKLDNSMALTDLDPTIGAYHEITWDGRTDQGDFVANGVYFYRMRVKKGKTVIERIGKVAKAR